MCKIVPRIQWFNKSGKQPSFQCTKIQKEPIFPDFRVIMSNTNFFQAFTASANVPALFLQQLLENTMKIYEKDWGKTSGSDKPRHPVLQMLWGNRHQTNVDHARVVMGRGLSRDPDNFSHTRHAQSLSEDLERITKKRTKNKAKTTKLDSEWKRL
ncbi:hypothetical protein Tco_0450516 [Tanacetum coccineum]